MKYIELVKEDQAKGEVQELYNAVKQKMGMLPNILAGLANSPAALKAYVTLSEVLENGAFEPREQKAMLLAVSQINQCYYCLSAHTAEAKVLGFSHDEVIRLRLGTIEDKKLRALTQLVREIVSQRGFPEEEYVKAFFNAGYSEAHFAELTPFVALKTMSNYFHHMTEVPIDIPKAPEIKEEA